MRRASRLLDPDVVVFAGDGEPQSPGMLAQRLTELSDTGTLKPDDYSLGGTVECLERRVADELGKEAAIWFPTGTLANHMALRRHAGTRSRVILQEQSHVYHDEGDALGRLSGLTAIPLGMGKPSFSIDELRKAFDKSIGGRVANPVGAVSVESPVRRQAGQVVPWPEMQELVRVCREREVPVHLDGARVYMMSAATGISVREYAALFDSVYVSMYKYFGATFGAMLAGTREFIEGMFHDRRMFGGGLAASYLEAGLALNGIQGFDERYRTAFAKALSLFEKIDRVPGLKVRAFENGSNIFELHVDAGVDQDRLTGRLLESGVLLPWPKPDWSTLLLHVNTTVLRRPNSQLVDVFSNAAAR